MKYILATEMTQINQNFMDKNQIKDMFMTSLFSIFMNFRFVRILSEILNNEYQLICNRIKQ